MLLVISDQIIVEGYNRRELEQLQMVLAYEIAVPNVEQVKGFQSGRRKHRGISNCERTKTETHCFHLCNV